MIAADSLAGGDESGVYGIRSDPKLFRFGPAAIGFTDSYRFGQILAHHLEPDAISGEFDAHRWAVRYLVPAIRAALSEHGWMGKDDEREQGGTALIAVRDRIFTVFNDFSVSEEECGFMAVGSAWREAEAALATLALTDSKLVPRKRLELALDVAAARNVWVKPPWHFLETSV